MWAFVVAAAPSVLLAALAAWAGRMKKLCPFRMPPNPTWPFAENPGLALEVADSPGSVDAILGVPGKENRQAAIRLQKLDFILIPLYVAFFSAAAGALAGWAGAIPALACILLAAILDVAEDVEIIRMVNGVEGSSARRYGQAKWFFYFAALAAEGTMFFPAGPGAAPKTLPGMALGFLLIATGAGGIAAALKGSFNGIASAAKLSLFGLVPLALAPLAALAPFSWLDAATYVVLMRVPLLVGAALFLLPFLAFFTAARSLLKGLFDLTPRSLFMVTLASLAVAGTVYRTASIILLHAPERFGVKPIHLQAIPLQWVWLPVMVVLAAPVIGFSLNFSTRQKHGFTSLLTAILAGAAPALATAAYLAHAGPQLSKAILPRLSGIEASMASTGLFAGYVNTSPGPDPLPDHLSSLIACAFVMALYAGVGVYGWLELGKRHRVPALASALMLLVIACWILSGVAFFIDQWRVPLLLIIALAGTLTAQSAGSDHYYTLIPRDGGSAPDPAETIRAGGSRCVVVVAANGGGIQAAAWAAQVLYGLYQDCGEPFRRSLRMISSVSGGSVGSAFFIHWLANRKTAEMPAKAAAKSSLDAVAWGLAWTDLLRALAPWIFRNLIGRGRALEKAWCLNSARRAAVPGRMDEALGGWNKKVAEGELPGLVMNATIAETGERLLLGTTRLCTDALTGRARVDAVELHTINGRQFDVGVATAARLSATFPYVTPASRSNGPGPQPHVVDGGYYDNYGMATLVEWLDEALTGDKGAVERVLVIQIRGSPETEDLRDERHAKSRGWFYQAFAPLTTLVAVRSAGQIAHNNIELELLRQKFAARGIAVESVLFEFHNPNVPLSWHLTREEVGEIRATWRTKMKVCRGQVRDFVAGG